MIFANYARKSVFSDRSDSVDNQFKMSYDYASFHFPGKVDSFLKYCDEDFTGANTNRPDLQRLLNDIRSGQIDVLIVYQLDRLSRDVRDFSNIYDVLKENNVHFVSVTENIDTTTPIGEAMMYVTVVFAQMERKNIALRVTDNMIGLAKKGYWTGGNPPYGYVRKRITVNGKKHVTIVQDPEGVEYNRNIFDTFLDNNYSLQSMETAFRQQGIRTIRGNFFSTTQLHAILSSPFCVEATPEIYDFFASKGCQMDAGSPREKWDGSVGVMVYGRTTEKNKKHQKQPPEKWIVCLGLHKPYISAEKWLAVQARFSKNKFDHTMKYDVPLLKGILRCSCGSIMNCSRKKKVDGSVSTWYYCLKRMRQGAEVCDRSQIKIDLLDEKVLDVLRSIEHDPALIRLYVQDNDCSSDTPDLKVLISRISSCESKIERLVSSLSMSENPAVSRHIISEIERLDLNLQALKRERGLAESIMRNSASSAKSAEEKAADISRFIHGLNGFNAQEKNEILRNVIQECTWDGNELFLKF